ncbi:FHIPEP family type III secretion protein [Butyrivibrio sp. MC2013]|uniref:FHIPEP family type III secretion protein n=1 Tax=Butyrivibrio sp. MC2013 TaxID=1280686 RepID=UPI0003F77808|nr:FHIPEP family type III secretion protein [Butyrivibrio sp. MC2013]
MGNSIGVRICHYRQAMKLTQEELASRIGVTAQAVSKWERDNGLPDLGVFAGIASVLGVSADTLLGIEDSIAENSDLKEATASLIAEPMTIEFGADVIPLFIEGLKTEYIADKRKALASETGMLMPLLHLRDNTDLADDAYQVLIYGKVRERGSSTTDSFEDIIDKAANCCRDNYADVLNKQLVKIMVDNIKAQYPGVADDLIPEKISYLTLERSLQERIRRGESIKDLIHIIEEIEESI